MFIDSHIHLTHAKFDDQVPCITASNKALIQVMDRDTLICELQNFGIECCIEPAIGFESNEKLLQAAQKYKGFLYPAVGLHPTRAPKTSWMRRGEIEKLAQDEKVIAIGELGLDYHYERKEQHRFRQMAWFIWQLRLAYRLELPLILHIRLADRDAIRILRLFKKKLHGGIVHCYNQGPEYARIYTEEFGFKLGIGGSLLQKDCTALEEAVKVVPLDSLVLETDGPYVKAERPENVSGKAWKKANNTSFIIPQVAEKIANLKGIEVTEVEKTTTENVKKLFEHA